VSIAVALSQDYIGKPKWQCPQIDTCYASIAFTTPYFFINAPIASPSPSSSGNANHNQKEIEITNAKL